MSQALREDMLATTRLPKSLSDLDDTSIGTPVSGDVLAWTTIGGGTWTPTTMSDLRARWIVIERVRETGSTVLGSSLAETITSTITIPTDWSTYDLEYYYTIMAQDASGGATGSANINTRARLDSSSVGSVMLKEIDAVNTQDLQSWTHIDFVEGETTTGSRDIAFAAWRNSAGDIAVSALEQILIVKAYRTL